MKKNNQSIKIGLLALCASASLTSCYKKFDADSYAPDFEISGYTASSEIQPSALVAHWRLDGNLLDTVSSTTGTGTSIVYVTGLSGQAASFNVGNPSYATATPSAAVTGLKSMTVSFWTKPTFKDADNNGSIDGILGLVTIANTAQFWGNLEWFVENGSTESSATIKVHIGTGGKDTWLSLTSSTFFSGWSNHALTYDASTSTFTYYINGSKVASATAGWTGDIAWTDVGPIIFGADQFQTTPSYGTAGSTQSWASYYTGYIDDVRIYNKALTLTEVNALQVLVGKGK